MKTRLVPTTGTPIVLGDDAEADFIRNLLPDVQRAIQAAPAFRAESTRNYARKNEVTALSWEVSRTHADAQAASAFVLDHPGDIPDGGTLEIHQSGGIRYMPNAVVERVSCIEHRGVATTHLYALRGDRITQQQP